MRCKIQNTLHITLRDDDPTDLTTVSGLEFYVKQAGFFREYSPTVLSAHEMLVTVPLVDAMALFPDSTVSLQFAFTDEGGIPRASDTVDLKVKTFLKEAGYGQ